MTPANTETITWKLVSTSSQANIDSEAFKKKMLLDQDPRWLITFVTGEDKQLARFVLEQSDAIIASATFLYILRHFASRLVIGHYLAYP